MSRVGLLLRFCTTRIPSDLQIWTLPSDRFAGNTERQIFYHEWINVLTLCYVWNLKRDFPFSLRPSGIPLSSQSQPQGNEGSLSTSELLAEAFTELVRRWDPISSPQRDALGLELYGDLVDIREMFWADAFSDLHGRTRWPKKKPRNLQAAQEARTMTFIQGNQVAALVTKHLDKWRNKMCLSSEPGISIGNAKVSLRKPSFFIRSQFLQYFCYSQRMTNRISCGPL